MAIESVEELLALLRDHPEWREQLQQVVLTDRLLALPADVGALGEAQQRTERALLGVAQGLATLTERVDALAQAQQRTEEHLQRIEALFAGLVEQMSDVRTRLDGVVGYVVERRYREKAHAYFAPLARRIHVLSGDELDELLEAAVADGQLTAADAVELRWADAVIRGRREDQEIYLVLEASRLIDDDDVHRAHDRAWRLAQTGLTAVAVVTGEKIVPDAAADARRSGVWVVTEGQVTPPSEVT